MSQGKTLEEAFKIIGEAKALWIASRYQDNRSVPLPHTMATYSGKTMLRMPTYLHEQLARSAKREGTSLNQYLVALLSARESLRVVQSVKDELSKLKVLITKQQTSSLSQALNNEPETGAVPEQKAKAEA